MSIYEPLPTSTSTRILELLPGPDLHVQIHVIDLSENHIPFSAISYAWGSDFNLIENVKCSDENIPITRRLNSFLHRLHPPLIFWVDALSINQNDLQERAQQVQMMNLIFGKAEQVIVDLGEEPAGFTQLQRLFTQIETSKYELSLYQNDWTPDDHIYTDFQWMSEDTEIWLALVQVLTQPYFERVWISQEFVLARRLSIMIGETRFGENLLDLLMKSMTLLNAFCLTRFLANELTRAHTKCIRSINSIVALRSRRYRYHQSQFPNLIAYLFIEHFDLKATDPRDKVFALCGFMSEPIQVDYTANLDSLSIEISKRILASVNRDFLWYSQNGKVTLPSWCVDIEDDRIKSVLRSTTIFGATFAHCMYRASGQTSLTFEITGDCLKQPAYLIDTVAGQGLLKPLDPSTHDRGISAPDLFLWYKESVSLLRQHFPNLSEEELSRMTWQTITGDKYMSDLDDFQYLLKVMFGPIPDDISEQKTYQKSVKIGYAFKAFSYGRICVTKEGRSAFAPPDIESNDKIAILSGIPVPYVLRETPNGTYRYVGQCYVYGMMHGEALDQEGTAFTEILIS